MPKFGFRSGLLAAVVCAAGLVGVTALPADANHRPNSYCSPTGDFCYGALKINGVRKLKIDSFVDFGKYQLCVRKQGGPPKECHRYTLIPKSGGTVGDTVDWAANFPNLGSGAYLARWSDTGGGFVTPLGPKVGFHA
jgi:hypothetical protein